MSLSDMEDAAPAAAATDDSSSDTTSDAEGRRTPTAGPGAEQDHTKDLTRISLSAVPAEEATDDESNATPNGVSPEDSPFIKMLRQISPRRSSLRKGEDFREPRKAHFPHDVREPKPRERSRSASPRPVRSEPGDPWKFSAKDDRKRRLRSRADARYAAEKAEELQDDVYFLWLDLESEKDEATSSDSAVGVTDRGQKEPLKLGSMRFIIDTGCGHNLIAEKFIKGAGAMGKLQRLDAPLTLNTAGGPSKALGTVGVACDKLEKGKSLTFKVMKKTPSVISVGELCMDRGYSFHWPVGSRPYLLLPGGQRLNLIVDGRIPYISSAGSEAWGQVGVAAASVLKRWGCAMNGANSYLDDPGIMGGPPIQSIRSRTTHELHTQDVIAEHDYVKGRPERAAHSPGQTLVRK